MSEKQKKQDELLNSNYDGIEEYDNDLPRWWVFLFYLTIAFGVIYVPYVHVMREASSVELASREAEAIAKRGAGDTTTQVSAQDEDARLALLVANTAVIESGRVVFAARCAACHGAAGGGLIGPNLTDRNWIHGGKLSAIKGVVERGVLEKGMVPWKGVLKGDEIDAVTVFVHSLRGTKPANPKAPEGTPDQGSAG